jgi:transmembrane sensor
MKRPERIGELLFLYTRKKLSSAKEKELSAWRDASPRNEALFQKETDPEHIRKEMSILFEAEAKAFEKFKQHHPGVQETKPKTIHSRIFYITRIAASVVTLLFLGLNLFSPATKNLEPGGYEVELVSFGKISAMLSDFRRGYLDSYAGIKIVEKPTGEVVCLVSSDTTKLKSKYYTLITPLGGMISIKFPDSTTVWLNTQSTIKYPANFSQDSIVVTIEGEAYFEQAPQSKYNYYINTDSVQITPSVATLNIHNYLEEPMLITFVKGSAKVHKKQKNTGTNSSDISISGAGYLKLAANNKPENLKQEFVPTQDLEEMVAWKNGRMLFHNASIQRIMNEISRWYNAEVVFEGTIPEKTFNLDLPRDAKFTKVVDALRQQGVYLTSKKKTITVTFK